jgi:hypothetical protein
MSISRDLLLLFVIISSMSISYLHVSKGRYELNVVPVLLDLGAKMTRRIPGFIQGCTRRLLHR